MNPQESAIPNFSTRKSAQRQPHSFRWDLATALNYGTVAGVAMILYFLLVDLIGHETAIFLRYFNLFILLGISFIALRSFYRQYDRSKTSYLSGLLMGFSVGAFGAFLLSVFTMLTFMLGSPDTANAIIERLPIENISIPFLAFILFLETAFLGLVGSFMSMQFFKDNTDTPGKA